MDKSRADGRDDKLHINSTWKEQQVNKMKLSRVIETRMWRQQRCDWPHGVSDGGWRMVAKATCLYLSGRQRTPPAGRGARTHGHKQRLNRLRTRWPPRRRDDASPAPALLPPQPGVVTFDPLRLPGHSVPLHLQLRVSRHRVEAKVKRCNETRRRS